MVKTRATLADGLFILWVGQTLGEVAGTFTALYESITDQSVAERLRACGPWVQAMLRQMVPMAAVEPLPSGRRFVVIDASSLQAQARQARISPAPRDGLGLLAVS